VRAVLRRPTRWSSSDLDLPRPPLSRLIGARMRSVAGGRPVGSPCQRDVNASATRRVQRAPTAAYEPDGCNQGEQDECGLALTVADVDRPAHNPKVVGSNPAPDTAPATTVVNRMHRRSRSGGCAEVERRGDHWSPAPEDACGSEDGRRRSPRAAGSRHGGLPEWRTGSCFWVCFWIRLETLRTGQHWLDVAAGLTRSFS
jgi:hypothetical protein